MAGERRHQRLSLALRGCGRGRRGRRGCGRATFFLRLAEKSLGYVGGELKTTSFKSATRKVSNFRVNLRCVGRRLEYKI